MDSTEKKLPLLRIAGVEPESIVDGPGFRYVIFVQGCPHHCNGCHNPQTHDFHGGQMENPERFLTEISENPLLKGITFSGGEPFCQTEALYYLGKRIKAMGKDLMLYSGFTLEQLLKRSETDSYTLKLLQIGDYLVDGPYVEAKRDLSLWFRGSSNQRIIDLKAFFMGKQDYILHPEEEE